MQNGVDIAGVAYISETYVLTILAVLLLEIQIALELTRKHKVVLISLHIRLLNWLFSLPQILHLNTEVKQMLANQRVANIIITFVTIHTSLPLRRYRPHLHSNPMFILLTMLHTVVIPLFYYYFNIILLLFYYYFIYLFYISILNIYYKYLFKVFILNIYLK